MSTKTQYNPNQTLNARLLAAGTSKTVYALVTPFTEEAKVIALGHDSAEEREAYFSEFREAWTGKQDALHEDFFTQWHQWASPVVKLDRSLFPYYYPTAGASEPLRQIIFDFAAAGGKTIHVFAGEYEGYKAMGEAAGLTVVEWARNDWRITETKETWSDFYRAVTDGLFFISQPSAIDGNVWHDFNEFIEAMPPNTVVADVTYVGAVPKSALRDRFNLNARSVRNVVFSLSKPFGCYYDRIGGVFCREENPALFGNKWFKGLTGLRIGRTLMQRHDVFDFPNHYAETQIEACRRASAKLGLVFNPCDIFILASSFQSSDDPLVEYLARGRNKDAIASDRFPMRLCLTPMMADMIGTL